MIEYENLKLTNLEFYNEYIEKLKEILNSGWFILGENVKKFEEEFASYIGVKHCIGVASGLDALTLALEALDLPKGSEVLVPSNTYIATILAVIRAGHKPVLVEPDIRTYNINPLEIEKKISKNTKAMIIVHLYGKPCDMDKIMQIVRNYNIHLIEDCAQSHGASYKNIKTGAFGIGCFSFYPTKNLGALGDGGAITTNDDELADRLRALRNYGSKVKYVNDYIGFNSRLDEIQAGFLRIKLKNLNKIIDHKRRLANIYLENLSDKYIKPMVHEDYFDVYHIFNIRHRKRDKLRSYLEQNGIKSEIHYPIPPHKQKALKGIISGEYPISEEIHNTTLSLPISYFHTEDDILKICEVLNNWSEL